MGSNGFKPDGQALSRLALVMCVALCVALLLARMIEVLAGRSSLDDLHVVFEGAVSTTLALLVYIVHQEASK